MSPTMFPISDELKEAADVFASERNISRAQLFREAIAEYIGYDLSEETHNRGRTKKYANAEERKVAQAARQKASRERDRKILEAIRSGAKQEDLVALANSVE